MVLEIVGYIGSALVVISMLMSSILKLRLINTAGSIISCIYAVLVGAMPLALMNACLIVINLYNLYKLRKNDKTFDVVSCDAGESLISYLVNHYKEDIRQFFPDFDPDKAEGDTAYLVLCNTEPAGMLIGKQDTRYFDVAIDYATPAYRDFSVADILYSKLPEHGINRLRYAHDLSDAHADYLRRMGYTEENGEWMLHIKH